MKAAQRLAILLGILQQSHYDAALFNSWLGRHPRPRDWDTFSGKAAVDWTPKARILFWMSITPSRLLPFALYMNLMFLRPFERLAVWVLARRAGRRMRGFKLRAVIGITGSFGKTTTKETLAAVLNQKFRVHKTPENVNTLLGVARWILRERFQDGDIAVVEMGAYRRGDISALCGLVRPTIGILTGLNEAHRERFGSLEETAAAKCELFDALPPGGIGLWNAESENLKDAVGRRLKKWEEMGLTIIPYSRNDIPMFLRTLEYHSPAPELRLDPPAGGLVAAAEVGRLLGMNAEEIREGCRALRPLPRRLEPKLAPGNRLLIDDSYNITLDGVKAALAALHRIERRKIGVFAGIPEGGAESDKINMELGRLIAPAFALILLRETPVFAAVERGLIEGGFSEENIIKYSESEEIEAILARVVQNGDCVYFSAYDWPAIYL